MSYDLQIWSVHSASAPEGLPTPTTWKAIDQSWIHERRDWQVVLGRSVKVLPEDVPETVAQTLPGIAYLTELNLSPIDAPVTARKFLSRSAAAIAKAIHGVVFDPQADYVTLPSGIKRFARPGPSESASVISMSWWFIDGPAARGEFTSLLDVLSAKKKPCRYWNRRGSRSSSYCCRSGRRLDRDLPGDTRALTDNSAKCGTALDR